MENIEEMGETLHREVCNVMRDVNCLDETWVLYLQQSDN